MLYPITCVILKPRYCTFIVAKFTQCEVDISVRIQVSGFCTNGSADVVDKDGLLSSKGVNHDDASFLLIGWM